MGYRNMCVQSWRIRVALVTFMNIFHRALQGRKATVGVDGHIQHK